MATTAQLNGLRALIRDLKYLLAFLSLIALAAVIFLASVSKRVPIDVIVGMMLTLGLLFFGALMELVDLRSRGPRVRAPAGSAVALLEEGRAEPEPEPAQQYVSMRLRDMRGQ
ncbi:hypothetical protein JADG_008228 [Aureobasidium aubasidani]|nr:hypothetical protein JADG_008228 [Aureobasidium pullulans]